MFDGDGLMSAVTFTNDGKLIFRNKFVRTDGYLKDKETGKMSMRGIFGTMRSGGILQNVFQMKFKHVANTNAVYHGGKLYALWEAGIPYVVNPETLDTMGTTDLGCIPPENDSPFAAHPRFDAWTGHLGSFSCALDPVTGKTKVRLYELDTEGRSIVGRKEISFVTDGAVLLHDFLMTKNYMIFVVASAKVNNKAGLKALLGIGAFAGAVDVNNDQPFTKVILLPRLSQFDVNEDAAGMNLTDKRIKTIDIPYHFNFHFVNAYENDEGNVVFDTVQSDKIQLGFELMEKGKGVWETADFGQVYPTSLVRYVVNPATKTMVGAPKLLSAQVPEFPSVPRSLSCKQHKYCYSVGAHSLPEKNSFGLGSAPQGAILKIDCDEPTKSESYIFAADEFPGEPIFVSKQSGANEDSGYVITYVVNGNNRTTDLCIFDVEGRGSLQKGPVSRIRMPTFLPPGLHGMFVEGV